MMPMQLYPVYVKVGSFIQSCSVNDGVIDALFTDGYDDTFTIEWEDVRAELLRQWQRITPEELDQLGRDLHAIAVLIARKYALPVDIVENYLRNFERTIPLVS